MRVEITFDPAKDVINQRKHRISLSRAQGFDFAAATFKVDDREDYGEVRYRAVSFIDARLYTLTFTSEGEIVRAISLRKATKYEEFRYNEAE